MTESLKPQQESSERWLELADKLDALQALKNDGRGVSTVRGIIASLRRGDIAGARAEAMNDGDKIQSYPDIKDMISMELFDGESYPYSNWYRKRQVEIKEE